MKTIEEQLKSARRELALRKNAYPRWVSKGTMKADAARHEIECMEAIVATLKELHKSKQPLLFAEVEEETPGEMIAKEEGQAALREERIEQQLNAWHAAGLGGPTSP